MKVLRKTIGIGLVCILMLSSFTFAEQPQDMTRVNFTKEILQVMDVEIEETLEVPFNDIKNKADMPFIATAADKKIVTGHGGEFYPNAPVTKEQAVIMLVRALGVINIHQDEASKTELRFSDAKEISAWAKPYMAYAVKYGIIDDSQGKLYPQEGITITEAQEMLYNFKEVFMRDGRTAVQVLQLADEHLRKLNTYQFKGSMDTKTAVKLPTGEEQIATSKGIQEGIFEAPQTIYTFAKNISTTDGQTIETVSEVYMKDQMMYLRNGADQEWTEMNLNPMMGQLEALMGNISGMGGSAGPQMSSAALKAIGMYARYGEDIEIDGEEYYVIKVDLDHEAFLEIYRGIMDETIQLMFEGELWEEMKKDPTLPKGSDEEIQFMIKSVMEQTLQNMNMEMTQEYHIHKEDKVYSKLKLQQVMKTNLMGVETNVEMQGEYEYYGFNEDVVFPEIQ